MNGQQPAPPPHSAPDPGRVLSNAVRRIADLWELTNEQLGTILGLSAATVSRLRSGGYELKPGDKAFELAQHIVRVFRSLDAIMGSDDDASVAWLRTPNLDLEGRPIDRIATIRGLLEVADYVDDFRAHV